jgi:methoxymalonate biosynthesis acyl carrier protein
MSESADSIVTLFREQLTVEVTDWDADLIDEGLMDSLMLVDLLTFLEQKFAITIDLEDLDIDNFRSIRAIARFVESRNGGVAQASVD